MRPLLALAPADVLRALAPYVSEQRRERIEGMVRARLRGVTVVLEDVHDPHNAAAVLRTCEALGLRALHVVEKRERFSPARKVTQGAGKWIDLVRHAGIEAASEALRASGFVMLGADPAATVTLERVPVDRPIALVFGNEHHGLSRAARVRLDGLFRIPQFGLTRSLNLSVAVALATFDVCRRRRALLGADGDLDAETQEALRAQFYRLSVRAAEAILRRSTRRGA